MNATQKNPRFPLYRWTAIPLLALSLALAACGKGGGDAQADADKPEGEGTAKAAEAVPVEVASVARRPIAAAYSGTAALEAPGDAQVVAKTSGVLLQLLAEEGDRVKAGQVVARIDPDRPRLDVARTEATLRKLESNYRRSQQLADKRLVSVDANEQIRYDLAAAKAAYDMARLELSYTNIVAPIDGIIAQRLVKKGNLIQLNSALFRIVDDSRLEATLNVPERELATMKSGLPVTLRVDAMPDKPFIGRIDRVSPVVDAGSGTFRVICVFEAGDPTQPGALKSGMFGRIGVIYDERKNALTVPRSALLEDEGEPAVFAVRDKKAVRVPVELGYLNGALAEVRKGLKEGEQVVTAGKVTLRDGTKVEVLNAESSGAKAVAQAATGASGGAVSQ